MLSISCYKIHDKYLCAKITCLILGYKRVVRIDLNIERSHEIYERPNNNNVGCP